MTLISFLSLQDLLERFMEGRVPLEGFLESFQSSRKVYHIRRAQAEKIQEFNRPEQKHKPVDEGPKKGEHPESRPNGVTASAAQGPPRVFQLRYGLTPAILVPHFPYSSAPTHAISLPPVDSRPGQQGQGQAQASGPAAPHPCPGKAVGLRVIGQIPGWPAPNRPVRLQQLYRPSPHQTEPPYR